MHLALPALHLMAPLSDGLFFPLPNRASQPIVSRACILHPEEAARFLHHLTQERGQDWCKQYPIYTNLVHAPEVSTNVRTNNAFRDIALPTGRQHPTHPNSKPPALIPTLQKNAQKSQETKLPQNNFCSVLTRPGGNKFSTNHAVPINARQSQVRKIATKRLLLWSHNSQQIVNKTRA